MPPKRAIKTSKNGEKVVSEEAEEKGVSNKEALKPKRNVETVVEAKEGPVLRKRVKKPDHVGAKEDKVPTKSKRKAKEPKNNESEDAVPKKRGRNYKQKVVAEENGDSALKQKQTEEEVKNEESPPKQKTSNEDMQNTGEPELWESATTIYEFSAKDINGEEVSLENYKGHVCIISNVASKCGHTKKNYDQFVELFNKYSEEKGLRILAFPCNQFGKQEPGDSKQICEFAKKKNVQFDIFEKIEVNGDKAHPLWKFLKQQIKGPKGADITWNFTKFIIDKDGKVFERHQPTVKPLDLVETLEKLW